MTKYRQERDPIEQVRARLLEGGSITEEELKKIETEIRAIVTEAADFATNDPEPDAAELWTDITIEA
ncbi:Dehydrogenase E1 component [compost metagenome]